VGKQPLTKLVILYHIAIFITILNKNNYKTCFLSFKTVLDIWRKKVKWIYSLKNI